MCPCAYIYRGKWRSCLSPVLVCPYGCHLAGLQLAWPALTSTDRQPVIQLVGERGALTESWGQRQAALGRSNLALRCLKVLGELAFPWAPWHLNPTERQQLLSCSVHTPSFPEPAARWSQSQIAMGVCSTLVLVLPLCWGGWKREVEKTWLMGVI